MKRWARTHRKALGWTLVGCAFVVVYLAVAAILTLRTYDQVKGPLHNAQNALTSLAHNPGALNTPLGRNLTEINVARASKEIAAAQDKINGSVGLKLVGFLPGLRTQKAGVQQLLFDLHATTVTAVNLLQSVSALAKASHGTNISLADLRSLGRQLGSAQSVLREANRPTSGLWGPLGADRAKFDHEDARATGLIAKGEDLTQYALPFLGGSGPRSYLVMGENNAEMRDQGAPLSYSLLDTSDGHITETNGGTIDNRELNAPAPGVVIPAGTNQVFGGAVTQTWQSANATANFEFSGRAMQAMFADSAGSHVNGVIGIDVVALEGLLSLTGPVSVSGIAQPITASNASFELLDQAYQGLAPGASQGPRREELAEVTSATFHELQSGNVDVVALARVLATEVAGRHLLLWDENPTFEKTLREVGASGAIDTDDPTRTFHVAVENATANKLDYFVSVAISDTVHVLNGGDVAVDTNVTVTNHAPAGQPASYQFGPDGVNSHTPGEYGAEVCLWGPRGSLQGTSASESGLVLNEENLSLLPGQSATAQFSTVIHHAIRHGRLRLNFVPQPRLTPQTLSISVDSPRLARHSTKTVRAVLSKTTPVEWDFSATNG